VYAEFAVGSDFLVSDAREAARPAWGDIAGGPDGVVADVDLTQAETYKITIYAFEPEQSPAAVALGAELGLHVDPVDRAGLPRGEHPQPDRGRDQQGPRRRVGGPPVRASPRATCSSVGDSGNDVSMFGVAGTAVAMGQASAEVKAAAHLVTEPFDDDGCALALHALIDHVESIDTDAVPEAAAS
jgi:hypothetical protein